MKLISMTVALTSLLIGSAAFAGSPSDLDGKNTPSGKIVYEFIEMMWNNRQAEQAFDKYVSQSNYTNRYGGGAEVTARAMKNGFVEEKANEAKVVKGLPDGLKFEIKKLFAQGDQVFVEVHAVGGRPGPGGLVWMLFRVKDGKITEHADLHGQMTDQAMADYVFK